MSDYDELMRAIGPPLSGVPEKWGAADATAGQIRELVASASMVSAVAERTLTAHDSDPPAWPHPLAEEAFHGIVGAIVRAIEPHTEADPAAILIQLLVGFGNLIGHTAYFMAEADRHHMNLFAVQVAETSRGRKGTSWGRVRQVLRDVDAGWAASHIAGGLSSGEGLIEAVRDEQDKVKANGEVVTLPGVADKRLLIQESEFASVLRQATREKNILSEILRQAWDSGDLRNMTVDGRRATAAHISINGHITKAELLRQITETEAANGFGNRFLWYCARRSRLLPDGGGHPELQGLLGRLAKAAEFARGVGEVRRDGQARALWHDVYGPLSEGRPGLLGALTARAEAQTMRLATLYALLDQRAVIGLPHLAAGLAVWQYCEDSARYIFGEALGDPTADTILAALRNAPDGLGREQIRSDVFGRNKPAGEIARALGVLRQQSLAVAETVETEGRPAEIWRAR